MKTKIAFMILAMSLITPHQAFAFKWSKCKSVYKPTKLVQPDSKDLGSILMGYLAQISSQATSQSSTSTSSYVTSTGECAAFAKADEERNLFIAETFTEIKMEAALGQGEHVQSLAALYGCDSQFQGDFVNMLKTHHDKIFSSEVQQDATLINQRITNQLIEVETLKNSCNLERI